MGKGGGSKNQTSTVTQTNIPNWARPYMENALQRGQEESNRPYQAYQGQRLADQTAQTTQGLNMIQNYAQSGMPDLANARSLSEMVGNRSMDLQNYQSAGISNSYGGPQDYAGGQFSADQQGFGHNDVEKLGPMGQQEIDQYMSPYMEDVIGTSQRDAQQKALQEQTYLKNDAAKAGAFGGSRGAIQQQLALNDAQKRISDIGVQGRQDAFMNAQQLARGAQTGNQAAAMAMAQANQNKNLEAQGMGEQSRQFGAQLGEQGRQKAAELGMTAQSQTEQFKQSGKDLGLRGLQMAGSTAGQLAGYQQMNDSMTMDRANAMLGTGQFQEERQQKQLDQAYQDFQNQQNWPLQRLSIVPSILNGVQMGQNSSTTQTQGQNTMQSVAGTAMAYDALQRIGRGQQ